MGAPSMIGRSGLPGKEDIVYDTPRSDAERTILGLVHESGGRKFNHIVIEYSSFNPVYRRTLSTPFDTNSKGELTGQSTLQVGDELLDGMYGVYRVYPEVVSAALRFGIDHELSHRTGIYSAMDKIVKNYVEREMRKIGPPPEGVTMKALVRIVRHESFRDPDCVNEREYKANLQAMTNRLKEPGMTFEKLEDEVAAMLWLIDENRYDADPFRSTEDVGLTYSYYLENCFPRLGDEFKEQITEKIFEIDKEYRKRYQLKGDNQS